MSGHVATLAADYPSWHIGRGLSGKGRETDWNVTLKGGRRTRRAAIATGALTRVTAPHGSGLRELLHQQDALRQGRAAG